MCYKLDCSNLLLNYFFENSKDYITINDLIKKKKQLESNMKDDLYVIINNEAIENTLFYYKDIFSLKNNRILCKNEKLREHSQNELNYFVPEKVKEDYLKLIRTR